MKVMVMVLVTPESEAGSPPSPEAMEAMGKFNEELIQAGILLAAEGLKPTSAGVRMRFDGASRTVTDGPFAETKELIAGFSLWQVRSMEEAIAWARKCPNPGPGITTVEIRPLYELEDFAEWDQDGEFAAGVKARREQVAAKV
jgi:PhnB protein